MGRILHESGVTQEELGRALGLTASAVSHKLAGRRPWMQVEVDVLLKVLRRRLKRRVTYEQLFGEAA